MEWTTLKSAHGIYIFKIAQGNCDDITRFCQTELHFISHLLQETFETKSLIRRKFILGFS